MSLYRRWGSIRELSEARIYKAETRIDKPVVAVTLARLKVTQTARFLRWGKPVERQIRDHSGQTMALAAMRPLATLSTFSIWKSQRAMTHMVSGKDMDYDGDSHKVAMEERSRKLFHHEFTTLRFSPLSEFGAWEGQERFMPAE